jgi:hypothetical protein
VYEYEQEEEKCGPYDEDKEVDHRAEWFIKEYYC